MATESTVIQNAQTLSQIFSRELLREIGIDNLRQVVAKNTGSSPLVCHSHEFCDANMVMLDSLIVTGVIKSEDEFCNADDNRKDALSSMMEEAWNLAKAANFYLQPEAATPPNPSLKSGRRPYSRFMP